MARDAFFAALLFALVALVGCAHAVTDDEAPVIGSSATEPPLATAEPDYGTADGRATELGVVCANEEFVGRAVVPIVATAIVGPCMEHEATIERLNAPGPIVVELIGDDRFRLVHAGAEAEPAEDLTLHRARCVLSGSSRHSSVSGASYEMSTSITWRPEGLHVVRSFRAGECVVTTSTTAPRITPP